ncbi:hypothetical protein GCM10009000_041330 [Halobacterium noricense]|uniref:Uncharacterized protein n=1 Tax=Haladaptatus pallidirubidus TaxID=1008152 RepID=A0AAV3UFX3_9EURY
MSHANTGRMSRKVRSSLIGMPNTLPILKLRMGTSSVGNALNFVALRPSPKYSRGRSGEKIT